MKLQDKIQETFDHFTPASTPEEIDKIVEDIIARRYKAAYSVETLRFLYSTIDLTTLAGADTKESVQKLVETVNYTAAHPEESMPNVAAICVYPLQVPVVKEALKAEGVRIAAVSGGFPASQTFLEIKLAETALTVAAGANEIDIVLNLNHFLPGDYSSVVEEIEEQKAACRSAHLKVILETGLLKDPDLVRKASILSLYSGADFIKTSTGKEYPGADLRAAYTMCCALRDYRKETGLLRGIKFSGGIRSAEEAVKYYCIVEEILGTEWMTNELFRIGASSLAGNLTKAISECK